MTSDEYTFLIIALVIVILIMIITSSRDVLERLIENKSDTANNQHQPMTIQHHWR